jgi:flagellar protein FlgJ
MISQTDLSAKAAFDSKGLSQLRQGTVAKDPAAIKAAATQFEAMFLNMVMKSMREATPQDGIMDSEQGKMFTAMLDQQTTQNMAKRGTGLADALIRQMTGNSAAASAAAGAGSSAQALAIGADSNALAPNESTLSKALDAAGLAPSKSAAAATDATRSASGKRQAPHVRAFQDKLGVHAEAASQATGIPAKFMLGQAALESGWGKHEITGSDGTVSRNLFGIKATGDWKGKTVSAVTTEYVNGVPQTKVEKFRAYDSYADSFKDYAKLITDNKRYEKVLNSGGDAASFAQGLQRAGYATDPHYATKLSRIINNSLS